MAIRIRELIDAGAHFGHPVSRWHPKMAPYIYGKRNLIHIIDLRQTVRGIIRARHFLKNIVAEGGQVLLIGTKRQAKSTVAALAKRVEMPYVSERWPGGMLTNFQTIRSRLQRLEELETLERDGGISRYSKKMVSSMRREKRKILRNLDGVRNMSGLPSAVLIVDPRHERIAVREAQTLRIPTVAIIDTDCDPGCVDIPVPANDDAFRSVQMILTNLVEAIEEGNRVWREKVEIARKKEEEEAERQRKIKEAREARKRAEAAKPAAPAEKKRETPEAGSPGKAVAGTERPAERTKPAGDDPSRKRGAGEADGAGGEASGNKAPPPGEHGGAEEVPAASGGETPAPGSS